MKTRRRYIPLLAAGLIILATAVIAQTDPAPAKSAVVVRPSTESKDESKPATASTEDREFKPTEKVSPDQEVDFPADL